jgi:2',3'-cyclic-nucleotide 2'-phosphodiesterase (5'-nucleotidase family)
MAEKKNNPRRSFLKKISIAAVGASIAGIQEGFSKNMEIASANEVINKKFTVNILQTTDVHCQIHPHDELFWENGKAVYRKTGGYAHLASYLKKERKNNPFSFLIDTGDMFQGSELSYKTTGKAMVPILNALNYDLFLPGNWEVIYYKKNMQQLMGALNAPKVCANMYHDLGNNTKGELIFHPYYIWHINGVKIGFLGYTDPLVPIRQSPNYSKGIIYTKPEENLAHYVNVLKNDEKCSYIAIVAHLGLSQQIALANMPDCEGVNIILGGDTHERVRIPIECKYAKVVEPGAFGSFVGKLQLTFENGKLFNEQYTLDEIDANKIKADQEMNILLKENETPFEKDINTVVGYSTVPLYRYFVIENTIDTLVLDALRWRLPEIDIVLSNGFRFCPPRTTPDSTGNIPITKGFIFDMLPVDSVIKTGEVTGAQLQAWLEKELNNVFAKDASKRFGGWIIKFQGIEMNFKAFEEQGKRVQSLTIKGQPIEANKVYSIAACERDGDPADMLCRIKDVKNAKNTAFTLHSNIIDYLKQNSPVTPLPKQNAKILDGSQDLLTQVFGVNYQFR